MMILCTDSNASSWRRIWGWRVIHRTAICPPSGLRWQPTHIHTLHNTRELRVTGWNNFQPFSGDTTQQGLQSGSGSQQGGLVSDGFVHAANDVWCCVLHFLCWSAYWFSPWRTNQGNCVFMLKTVPFILTVAIHMSFMQTKTYHLLLLKRDNSNNTY